MIHSLCSDWNTFNGAWYENFMVRCSRSHDFSSGYKLQTHRMLLSKACCCWYLLCLWNSDTLTVDFLNNLLLWNLQFIKSWFSFRTSSRPLEVHTDRRQALAQGEVEGGSASTTCAIANQIVSNVPAVLSQNFCSTEYLLLFRSCHCSMVVLGWLQQ